MANPINYVPLDTPFFDGRGDPEGPALVKKLGHLSRTWAIFFASESGWVTQGLHVDRVGATAVTGLDPRAVPDGAVFVETDRSAIYESRFVNKAQAWVFVLGRMQGLLASRPTDLGTNDAGFLFVATDALDYRWSGSAWVAVDTARGGASLTHVDRVVKVTAAGTIGEAAFEDTDVVLGAPGLTTDGALPKVSATDGTLEESAIVDDGTDVTLTRAIAGAVQPGWVCKSQVAAKNRWTKFTDDERLDLSMNLSFDGTEFNLDDTGEAGALLTITPTQFRFWFVAAGANPATARVIEKMNLTGGKLRVGDGTGATYALESAGDISAAGVYRVGVTQVVGSQGAAVTAPTLGATIDAQARTAINDIISRLHAHGLIA